MLNPPVLVFGLFSITSTKHLQNSFIWIKKSYRALYKIKGDSAIRKYFKRRKLGEPNALELTI